MDGWAGRFVVGRMGFEVKSVNDDGNGTPGLTDEKEASTDAREAADNDDVICSGVRLVVGSASEVMSVEVDDCASGGGDCVVIVVLAKTYRLISLFKNRGRSNRSSTGGAAGAAAAKHNAPGSNVDRTASEAAIITDDRRTMLGRVILID